MGKGEVACTSNFSFSHKCFQKASFPGLSKCVIVLEWIKLLLLDLTMRRKKAFENLLRKGGNGCHCSMEYYRILDSVELKAHADNKSAEE